LKRQRSKRHTVEGEATGKEREREARDTQYNRQRKGGYKRHIAEGQEQAQKERGKQETRSTIGRDKETRDTLSKDRQPAETKKEAEATQQ